MKAVKHKGFSRRPAEWFLLVVFIVLIALAFFIQFTIRSQKQDVPAESGKTVEPGTAESLEASAEEETIGELETARIYDKEEALTAEEDAAADDMGGVYDESAY